MSEFFIPDGTAIEFSINDVQLGLVESYSVQTVYDTKMLRAVGQNDAAAILQGGRHHVVTLRRLLPAHDDFLDTLLSLQDFSFSITRRGKGYYFTGCEMVSHIWSCDSAGDCLEEAKFYSATCIPMIVKENADG